MTGDPGSGRPAQGVTTTGNDKCRCPFSPILSSSTCHSHLIHPYCQCHHLPRVQMQTGGGFFFGFDVSIMTATSLASKCKSGVVFLSALTHLLQPPPPLHPNVSQRWFQCVCHIYHLQFAFGCELEVIFSMFQCLYHHHLLSGGGIFSCFDMTATNSSEYNLTMAIWTQRQQYKPQ